MKPHLAITMGDPAGVGPEIIVKACAALRGRLDRGDLRLLVVGSVPALRAAGAQLGELALAVVAGWQRRFPAGVVAGGEREGDACFAAGYAVAGFGGNAE